MALVLARVDRIERTYTAPAGATAVSVALLTPRTAPTAATVWTSIPLAGGNYTATFVGPDASSTGAVVVPATADLWRQVTTPTGVDAEYVERIYLQGGGAVLAPTTGTPIIVGTGAGGFLSGTFPSPGVNEVALDNAVAAAIADPTSASYAAVVALIDARSGFGR